MIEITEFLFEQYKLVHDERNEFIDRFRIEAEDAASPEEMMQFCHKGITKHQLRLMKKYLKKSDWDFKIAWRKYVYRETINPMQVERRKKKSIFDFIFK